MNPVASYLKVPNLNFKTLQGHKPIYIRDHVLIIYSKFVNAKNSEAFFSTKKQRKFVARLLSKSNFGTDIICNLSLEFIFDTSIKPFPRCRYLIGFETSPIFQRLDNF